MSSPGVTLADLQTVLNASEGRTEAALAGVRSSIEGIRKTLDDKLDPVVRDSIQSRVRIAAIEEELRTMKQAREKQQEQDATIINRAAKSVLPILLAAATGGGVAVTADKTIINPERNGSERIQIGQPPREGSERVPRRAGEPREPHSRDVDERGEVSERQWD